jgi:histidyl-tRNA synthetase
MLDLLFKRLGLDGISVEINNLGCKECRPVYMEKLVAYFNENKKDLCEDCIRRLEQNPLRLLDCKNSSCIKVIEKAPVLLDSACNKCTDDFDKICGLLDSSGVKYRINKFLVRGLDYYSGTVFEFIADELGGRMNAVGGGGRYDGLSKDLGAGAVPAVGFACGIERLLLLLGDSLTDQEIFRVYICPLDEQTLREYLPFLVALKAGTGTDSNLRFIDEGYKVQNIGKLLTRANKANCRFALIFGETESKNGTLVIKDLDSGVSDVVNIRDGIEDLYKRAELIKEVYRCMEQILGIERT